MKYVLCCTDILNKYYNFTINLVPRMPILLAELAGKILLLLGEILQVEIEEDRDDWEFLQLYKYYNIVFQ